MTDVLAFIKPPFSSEKLRIKYGHPVQKLSIIAWEQRHSLHLPDDLKNFYYSYDGISCYLMKERTSEVVPPSFRINPIAALVKVGSGPLGGSTATNQQSYNLSLLNTSDDDELDKSFESSASSMVRPRFGPNLMAFELSKERDGKYCLFYSCGQRYPTVWFLDRALEWHFVACNFISFFRLRLASLCAICSSNDSL